MARYIGPKSKIARKFNEPIYGPDKFLEKRHSLRDNMVPIKEGKNSLSTVFSFRKNKKLNILMEYLKDSFVIYSSLLHERKVLLVKTCFN